MPRRFAIFTGTRAEYGLLRPVLQALNAAVDCECLLIVSGTHLSSAHGRTLSEIEQDGFSPAACVDPELGDEDTPITITNAMGKVVSGAGRVLESLRPDVLVVLGDRYETFATVAAAQPLNIPVAHIQGGEITEGAMDEVFRHAITKMSHVHFTSCEAYRQRVIQLGEAPDRVYNVGSLGVENALNLVLPDEQTIRNRLGITAQPYLLCTFHPVTLSKVPAVNSIRSLLGALEAFTEHVIVFTGANADAGGAAINRALQREAEMHPERYRFFMSLGASNYLAAAMHAACVIGNSSSGIIEVPSLGTPVVDIGDRQKGRIRSDWVLHCDHEAGKITETVQCALDLKEAKHAAACAGNPYHKDGTANAIVECLRKISLEGLLHKSFHDLFPSGA